VVWWNLGLLRIRPFNVLILLPELRAGGIAVSGLCTSYNIWMVWKATQLMLKCKIAQLTNNFPKGDMPITVTVKFLGRVKLSAEYSKWVCTESLSVWLISESVKQFISHSVFSSMQCSGRKRWVQWVVALVWIISEQKTDLKSLSGCREWNSI
jgi:hypothetical protein